MSTLIDKNGRIVKLSGSDDPTVKLVGHDAGRYADARRTADSRSHAAEKASAYADKLDGDRTKSDTAKFAAHSDATHKHAVAHYEHQKAAAYATSAKDKNHHRISVQNHSSAEAKHKQGAKDAAASKADGNRGSGVGSARPGKAGGDAKGGGGSSGGANQYGPY